MTEPQNDRVSYSLGMKVNLGNYQSADVHMSFSTDVREGEDREDAFQRAKEFVEAEVEKKYDELRSISS